MYYIPVNNGLLRPYWQIAFYYILFCIYTVTNPIVVHNNFIMYSIYKRIKLLTHERRGDIPRARTQLGFHSKIVPSRWRIAVHVLSSNFQMTRLVTDTFTFYRRSSPTDFTRDLTCRHRFFLCTRLGVNRLQSHHVNSC